MTEFSIAQKDYFISVYLEKGLDKALKEFREKYKVKVTWRECVGWLHACNDSRKDRILQALKAEKWKNDEYQALFGKISIRTIYLMLNLAKDFKEARDILEIFFIRWSDDTYTAYSDGNAIMPVMIDKEKQIVYILEQGQGPEELAEWLKNEYDDEPAIIDYKIPLAIRLIRESFVSVSDFGCGDHSQDRLENALHQVWYEQEGKYGELEKEEGYFLHQGYFCRNPIYKEKKE